MTKKTNKNKKNFNQNLMKTLIIFFIYLLYSQLISFIFGNNIIASFIADILYLILITYIYKDNIIKDLKNIKKNYTPFKFIKKIILYFISIFLFVMLLGMITNIIAPADNSVLNNNNEMIQTLFTVSSIYTIFKTMIFGVIAEELLFRESVRDLISNKWLFIIISAFIYTIFQNIFTSYNDTYFIINNIGVFLTALFFSFIYYKNDSNIVTWIIIKFIYQLIPLTLMFISM